MKYTLNQPEIKAYFSMHLQLFERKWFRTSKLFVKYTDCSVTVCAGIARVFKDIHVFLLIIICVDNYGQD